MKVSKKGQVTIPLEIRRKLGLHPDGRRLVERMRGRADTKLSTEQILALTRGRST